jgi:hypothetical protein
MSVLSSSFVAGASGNFVLGADANRDSVKIWSEIFDRMCRAPGKTLGKAVAESTGGANLVDGKQT